MFRLGLLHHTPTTPLDRALHNPNGFWVRPGQEIRRHLDDRELASEGLVRHAKLKANDAPADHQHPGRHPSKAHRVPGAYDMLIVECETRDLDGLRTCGEDDGLLGNETALASVTFHNTDHAGFDELAGTLHECRPIRLQQAAYPTCELRNDSVLPILHAPGVQGHASSRDSLLPEPMKLSQQVRIGDERLGRDATPIQTHASDLLRLHAGNAHAELSQSDRADITTRPAAQDHCFERAFAHGPCL